MVNVYICFNKDGEGGIEVAGVWADIDAAYKTRSYNVEEWPISGLEGKSLDADELRLALPIALEATRHFQHCRACGEGEKCFEGDKHNQNITALEAMLTA